MKTVTNGEWCVSTTSGTGIKGVILSVFKVISNNPYKIRYGDHNGKQFNTIEEADAFNLKHGYTKTFSRVDRFGPLQNSESAKRYFEDGKKIGQRRVSQSL